MTKNNDSIITTLFPEVFHSILQQLYPFKYLCKKNREIQMSNFS